jgi:AcrR family transcriptional regulator
MRGANNMPKVTQEYFDNKRRMIVESCYQVCLRKPVEMVTISDVIAETGLSQGGIYRFYKDLDEILTDMITNMRRDYDITDKLDAAVADQTASFEVITRRICRVLAEAMEAHLMDIQKINFDLTVLAINEPERAGKIIGNVKGKGNMDHLAKVIFPYLFKASAEKKLEPRHDPMELYQFISSAYVGIETNCILTACYGKAPMQTECRPGAMFDILATTIIMLFGGDADKKEIEDDTPVTPSKPNNYHIYPSGRKRKR